MAINQIAIVYLAICDTCKNCKEYDATTFTHLIEMMGKGTDIYFELEKPDESLRVKCSHCKTGDNKSRMFQPIKENK